jgi:hypothetical protein
MLKTKTIGLHVSSKKMWKTHNGIKRGLLLPIARNA